MLHQFEAAFAEYKSSKPNLLKWRETVVHRMNKTIGYIPNRNGIMIEQSGKILLQELIGFSPIAAADFFNMKKSHPNRYGFWNTVFINAYVSKNEEIEAMMFLAGYPLDCGANREHAKARAFLEVVFQMEEKDIGIIRELAYDIGIPIS